MFENEAGEVDWIPVKYYKRVFGGTLSRSLDDDPLRIKRPRKGLNAVKRALLTASGFEESKNVDIPEVVSSHVEIADEEESENIAVSSSASSSSEEEEEEEMLKGSRKKKKK